MTLLILNDLPVLGAVLVSVALGLATLGRTFYLETHLASKDDLAAAVTKISADITALQGRVGDVVSAADAQTAVAALNAADAVVNSIAAA